MKKPVLIFLAWLAVSTQGAFASPINCPEHEFHQTHPLASIGIFVSNNPSDNNSSVTCWYYSNEHKEIADHMIPGRFKIINESIWDHTHGSHGDSYHCPKAGISILPTECKFEKE